MGGWATSAVIAALADGGQTEGSSHPSLPVVNPVLVGEGSSIPRGQSLALQQHAGVSSLHQTPLPNLFNVQLATFGCDGGSTDVQCNAFEGAHALLRNRTGRTAVPMIELTCACRDRYKVAALRDLAYLQGGFTTVRAVEAAEPE